MSEGLLTQEQAVSELLAFIFSGAIGSAKGKAVGYSLVAAKPTEFSWWVALAFQACWSIPIPQRLIGELVSTKVGDDIILSVGPDRHNSLGGPFQSVREYLQAYIRASIVALEKQEGIQEYKDKYLKRIKDFVNDHMHEIPPIVEDVPIVAMHSDMGPHNIIVSSQTPTDLEAVIDWEFVASAPFASLHRIIEMLFRESAANEFGPEYDRASELREAFWDTIPDWKLWVESEPCRVFLEWFRFGLFMKPEWRPDDLAEEDAREFWRENIRVVEGMLEKYI
ncbi:hypothetical protein E5D57_001124 [Metarhizium anisopliae]|nr:hypothetical protein E5D57_001124 [Metarhizium anisopliae]